MIKATCTWGDGPDVMLTFKDYRFVLYEDPKHTKPPQGGYAYGYVTKGSTDLTADEALMLAARLIDAANAAKELDSICRDVDEAEVKAMNDVPLESLTCHKCKHRNICKYADDAYNTEGDCLMMK